MTAHQLATQNVAHRSSRTLQEVVDRDLLEAFRAWPLWTMLGWNDIRQRYRRSVLGPFWITLSMAIFIVLLGVIYSKLFHMDIATYLPYLTVGFILWGFISTNTIESCTAFQANERIIRQIRLPYSIYVLHTVWRNFIVFLHTIVIFIPVAVIFSVKPGLVSLLAIPGLLLLYINQIWIGLVLAIVSTRYRDVLQLVTTAVQIAVFVTPIMWPVTMLKDAAYIAYLNPFFHLIDIVRAPMLGTPPLLMSWVAAVAFAIIGWVVAILLLRRAALRLVFWL